MATSPLRAFSIPTCTAKSPNPAFFLRSAFYLSSTKLHVEENLGSVPTPSPIPACRALLWALSSIPSCSIPVAHSPGFAKLGELFAGTGEFCTTRTPPWWLQLWLPPPRQAQPSNADSRGKAMLDFRGIKPKGFSSARQGSNKLIS